MQNKPGKPTVRKTKKVIIAEDIKEAIKNQRSFFDRTDLRIVGSSSNVEVLDLHRAVKADLIIIRPDMPGPGVSELCATIREDPALCHVSIIVVCPDEAPSATAQAENTPRANVLLRGPINPGTLIEKARGLLEISKRDAFRAPIGMKVNGKYENRPFLCQSENISASGLLIETDKELSKDDIIVYSFLLPNSTRIASNAKIARVAPKLLEYDTNHYGIKFLDISEHAVTAIEAYIREKKPQGF